MGVRVKVTMNAQIGQVFDDIQAGLLKGETKAAERLLALSAAEVPLRDGPLLASGHVVPAKDAEEGAAVVYDAPYAARWHEDGPLIDSLGRRYSGGSNFQNGRKSKYVEDPAVTNRAELGNIIRAEIKRGAS